MPRLGAGLFSSPTGPLLLDLARARAVTFGTNERGFEAFSCFVPLALLDSFYLYDRATLPHIAVTWAGGIVWEGRLEDVTITAAGLRLTALGYIRGYSDTLYSTAHIGVTASTIVKALIASVSATNTFMASSTILVQDPGVTLAEIYEDKYPIDILDRLCNLGDTATPPRLWEAGVWENRILHFRPRGAAARKWSVDVSAPEIERTLETLRNSVYAAYQNGANARVVTSTSTDATSIARYGVTRQAAPQLQAIDATLAGYVRDAYLADHKDPPVRADVGFRRLYDQFGTLWPAYVARSGDQVTIRNLPPSASSDIDRIRTFRVKETHYDADEDWLTVVPESLQPGLGSDENARRIVSVTDPNNQFQPRPTLASLYADFQGLLGLRGLWYPGSVDNTGALYDQSGQGRTLTYNGNPTLNIHNGFIPYWDYDGTGDYHSRADEAGTSITGTETTLNSSKRGLTLGGWFWVDNLNSNMGLLTKFAFTAGNQRSYSLLSVASAGTGVGRLSISSDGTSGNQQNIDSAAGVLTAGTWNFMVGRFTPSTELKLWVNSNTATNTSSIKASLYDSTAALQIGAQDAGSANLDGRMAIAFLCAALLTDEQISHLFERTRKFFGA